jgi:sarcosine oxidase gamma subunit
MSKLVVTGLVALLLPFHVPAQEHNLRLSQALVPDEKTAISIAVAVWIPIYGEKQISLERPYVASLSQGKWTVVGSIPGGGPGGTAIAVIAEADGQVFRVSHGR